MLQLDRTLSPTIGQNCYLSVPDTLGLQRQLLLIADLSYDFLASRYGGTNLFHDFNSLMSPRQVIDFQVVQLYLLRMGVTTSKVHTCWSWNWKSPSRWDTLIDTGKLPCKIFSPIYIVMNNVWNNLNIIIIRYLDTYICWYFTLRLWDKP